jgi:hypothetical protein
VCSFSNIRSHRKHLLFFVKRFSKIILANKYRIRQSAHTGNKISGHRKCLSVSIAHRVTKQLKLRPYRFQAVHQLQEGEKAAILPLVSSSCARRDSCMVCVSF